MEKRSMQKMVVIGQQFALFTSPAGFFEPANLDRVIADPASQARVWGANHRAYLALNPGIPAQANHMQAARDACKDSCEMYFQGLIQRRHDCIHNCDRPNIALQRITSSSVTVVLDDIQMLISEHERWINVQFPIWLARQGCPAVAIGAMRR
jgi:hypothetical protein